MLINSEQMAKRLCWSKWTMRDHRIAGRFREGLHYHRLSRKHIVWDVEVMDHYIRTRDCPHLHDEYLAKLKKMKRHPSHVSFDQTKGVAA